MHRENILRYGDPGVIIVRAWVLRLRLLENRLLISRVEVRVGDKKSAHVTLLGPFRFSKSFEIHMPSRDVFSRPGR